MTSINFGELIQELADAPVCNREHLSIWGGEFPAGRLNEFLQAWQLGQKNMPWRIWEWFSDILLEYEGQSLPPVDLEQGRKPEWLERGRIFGSDGDLSLRRNGDLILWRFVGPRMTALMAESEWEENKPKANHDLDEDKDLPFLVNDYWRGRPADWELQVRTCSTLLWGQERRDLDKNPMGTWHDDRIGGVKSPLVYPNMQGVAPDGRVQLCYREYLRGGNVEAVWWLGLKGLNERCEEESHE